MWWLALGAALRKAYEMDVTELTAVVDQARWAPSVHNTQPWRFRIGSDLVQVWADRDRAVPVIDPTGRQLHISCGAAIEFTRLAIRALGRECALRLLPDPSTPDLLAELSVGALSPASPDEELMVAAIPRRHTYRDPFDPRELPAELLEALRQEVATSGGWLHVLHRGEDLVAAAVLLAHAEEAELAEPAYRAELARWAGVDPEAVAGVPAEVLSTAPVGERATTLRLRDFRPTGTRPDPGMAPPVERPVIVVVGTEADDRQSWLTAGRGLARLLLRAAAEDVQASPLNQVLDQPAFRVRFAHAIGLVGFPQMVLRLGYAHPQAATARRPLIELIEPPPTDAGHDVTTTL